MAFYFKYLDGKTTYNYRILPFRRVSSGLKIAYEVLSIYNVFVIITTSLSAQTAPKNSVITKTSY